MWDDDEDREDDDDDETVPCPHCRASVYEDAERCPHCGTYLSREDAPWSKPAWIVVGVAVCLGIVAWWTFV